MEASTSCSPQLARTPASCTKYASKWPVPLQPCVGISVVHWGDRGVHGWALGRQRRSIFGLLSDKMAAIGASY